MLKRIKSAGRRFVVGHPRLNGPLRRVWGAVTVGPLEKLRDRFPIVGDFPVRLPGSGGASAGRGDGRILLSTRREDWALNALYWHGFDAADAQDVAIFKALAGEARTVLDVGANIGLFAVTAARANPGAKVHAFEPLPAVYEVLVDVIARNRAANVRAHRLALSDRAGTATLHVPRKRECNVRDASLMDGWREDCDDVEVELTTLDRFVEAHGVADVDLAKVDVETAEPLVVAGGMRTLREMRPAILCEVLPGPSAGKLRESLGGLGYRYFWSGPAGLVERPELSGDPSERHRNYLLVPVEKVEATRRRLGGVATMTTATAAA